MKLFINVQRCLKSCSSQWPSAPGPCKEPLWLQIGKARTCLRPTTVGLFLPSRIRAFALVAVMPLPLPLLWNRAIALIMVKHQDHWGKCTFEINARMNANAVPLIDSEQSIIDCSGQGVSSTNTIGNLQLIVLNYAEPLNVIFTCTNFNSRLQLHVQRYRTYFGLSFD